MRKSAARRPAAADDRIEGIAGSRAALAEFCIRQSAGFRIAGPNMPVIFPPDGIGRVEPAGEFTAWQLSVWRAEAVGGMSSGA